MSKREEHWPKKQCNGLWTEEGVIQAQLGPLRCVIRAKWPITYVTRRNQEYFYSSLDASAQQGYSQQFTGTFLYTWVKRDAMIEKCRVQEQKMQCPWPGRKSGPLDLKMGTPTMRPLCLPHVFSGMTLARVSLHPGV